MAKKIDYRSRGTRLEKPIVIIMGDGLSESTYFELLNGLVDGVRIRVVSLKVAGWKKILSKCGGFVKNEGVDTSRDVAAIVTDEDGRYDIETMEQFKRECERKGYRLYLSNISFEVWLLMHYEYLTKPMGQEELEERIGQHLGRLYVKAKGIPITKGLVDKAICNVYRGQGSPSSGIECLDRNPSTMVGSLVECIFRLQSQSSYDGSDGKKV